MKKRYIPITCLYPSESEKNFMPLICIGGKWLENAGFIVGDEVSVKVARHGVLIISLISEEETCGDISGKGKSR